MTDNERWLNDKRTQELIDKIKSDYLSKGEVPYTASRVEQGYVEDTFSANGSGSASVTFTSPMPDTDYLVVTDCDRVGVEVAIINKSVNGFTLVVSNNNTSDLTLRVDYTAFELFELTTLAEIESDVQTRLKIVFDMTDIETPAENQTVLYMGETTLVEPIYKQGGIYEYDGTKWQLKSADNITFDDELSLDSENGVQNKVITQAVNKRLLVTDTMETATAELEGATRLYIGISDDYAKGGIYQCQETETDVFEWVLISTADVDLSSYETSWTGTQMEWNALSDEEKGKYEIVRFTDDTASGGAIVVDEVTKGNLNPVTSNAVAKKIEELPTVESGMKVAKYFLGQSYTSWTVTAPNLTENSGMIIIESNGRILTGTINFLHEGTFTDGTHTITCTRNPATDVITFNGDAQINTTSFVYP